jgi:hypothetical protein
MFSCLPKLQPLPCNHPIVKREIPVADDLVILVSLSCDEDDIRRIGKIDSGSDRLTPVRKNHIPLPVRKALEIGDIVKFRRPDARFDFPDDL